MKKIAGISLGLLLLPFAAFAQTSTQADYNAALLQLISLLTQQVQMLETELQSLTMASSTPAVPTCTERLFVTAARGSLYSDSPYLSSTTAAITIHACEPIPDKPLLARATRSFYTGGHASTTVTNFTLTLPNVPSNARDAELDYTIDGSKYASTTGDYTFTFTYGSANASIPIKVY